jgi:chromosome segregation ATPase
MSSLTFFESGVGMTALEMAVAAQCGHLQIPDAIVRLGEVLEKEIANKDLIQALEENEMSLTCELKEANDKIDEVKGENAGLSKELCSARVKMADLERQNTFLSSTNDDYLQHIRKLEEELNEYRKRIGGQARLSLVNKSTGAQDNQDR